MEVGMPTSEEQRMELSSLPDEALETLVELRFVWKDSVTREARNRFYLRQQVAEDIQAERRGVARPEKPGTDSIWNESVPRF